VSVNAEGGVVYLRGRLDSEREIEELVRAAGAVEGVKRVESKLHTPQATSEQGS
jgi:osmotically-inducible protein OsmY